MAEPMFRRSVDDVTPTHIEEAKIPAVSSNATSVDEKVIVLGPPRRTNGQSRGFSLPKLPTIDPPKPKQYALVSKEVCNIPLSERKKILNRKLRRK